MKRRLTLALFLFMMSFCLQATEIPDFHISPEQNNYKGFGFEVYIQKQNLMHKEFEICDVVIAITPEKRKIVNRDIWIEVWDDKQFVYSSVLNETSYKMLTDSIQKKIKNKKALLFEFRLNPKYMNSTWISYQVEDGDEVEMNCLIKLKDYYTK